VWLQVLQNFAMGRAQIAPHKLLPGLSQAVSSIAHPHRSTQEQIQKFVAAVAKACPNHSLWLLFAVTNSHNRLRRAAADTVIHTVRQQVGQEVQTLMAEHAKICQGIMVRQSLRDALGRTPSEIRLGYLISTLERLLGVRCNI
jgi:hypothetical protein